jgi:hypothetical protein
MNCRRIGAFFSFFLLITIALTCGINSIAQNAQYNLSIRNGLPSNHVYRSIVDKHGYLWASTEKGIVKYNGYTTKIFDASDGIPNADIWNIFEDKKGRIWLATIGSEMGYILHDTYHKAYLDKNIPIYPVEFINYRDGIMFLTGDMGTQEYLSIEKNDTIRTYNNIRQGKRMFTAKNFLHPKMGLLTFLSPLYRLTNTHFRINKFTTDTLKTIPYNAGKFIVWLHEDYIIPEFKRYNTDTILSIINVAKDKELFVKMKADEDVINAMQHKNDFYIITTSGAYKYDSNFKLSASITNDSASDRKINIVAFTDDIFWQRSIATSDNGLILEIPQKGFTKTSKPFLQDKYVGNYNDSIYYWWNNNTKKLSVYTKERFLYSTQYNSLRNINKIVSLSLHKFLVLNNRDLFQIDSNKLSLYYPIDIKEFLRLKDSSIFSTSAAIGHGDLVKMKLQDCIIDSNNLMHAVLMGFGYSRQYKKQDSLISQIIDTGRYEGIIFYPFTKSYIVYGKTNILIDNNQKITKISQQQLASVGIWNIQQILVDTLGDIFIKAANKLFVYNPRIRKFKSLYDGYNLNATTILLYKDKIITVGRFGVICSKISECAQLSHVATIINYKAKDYFYINSTYIIGDELYINTDAGGYIVDLNNIQNGGIKPNIVTNYYLHVSSRQIDGNINSGDTLNLDQNNIGINFDFINPVGDGPLKYTYSINGHSSKEWALADHISLPIFTPGECYKITLVVSDESWKSKPYVFYIMLKPYWWQRSTGKALLFILFLLGLSAVSFVTILATKHILNKRHAKENKYLELELKSIYAQLNPHFIFNTLSNIIYYIKKNKNQEAHKYLNTFSKLLRSYIKSSRNKWLPLNEEIENIENYIILQQSRFENKFDYTIAIDTDLDTENIQLPSLLLQPLVENAIHHGLQQKDEKGMLTLSFKKGNNENTIVIVIEDDGIGRARAKQFANSSVNKKESFGSNLIEDLITIYKRYELFSIDINYYDKAEPLTGTIVTLTIKYES